MYLVEQGADINAKDAMDRTPISVAAFNGQTDTVIYLLDQGADINLRGESGSSLLLDAINGGHVATAKALVDRGLHVDFSNVSDLSKKLLLDFSVVRDQRDVLQLLLDVGFPLNTIALHEKTLLMEASRAGKCDYPISS